ncbi:MAG: hypothetical protein IKK67_09680, partial [Bacteroidaceae bacterium]|nr:hypothetical protein [Bacteroidaceae bacterium]
MKKIVAFIAVLIYMTCTATVWGQADYTSSIKNAGFDTYASTGSGDTKTADNWTFEVKNNYATNFTNINNCAEQWKRNFNFYQDVVNLPNGLYKVSVQGFYRDGGIGGANAKARKAYLYADEAEIPLMNILDEEGSGVTGGSTVSGYNSKFPNNITEASTAFTNNYYSDNSLYVMVSDNNLRIGIKKDETFDADWVCFDNFKLTYYGTSASFYLRNRETKKFLTGGNNWGTQASLHETGIDFELTLSNGKYTIKSNVGTENSIYLSPDGESGFLNKAPTEYKFENVDENFYVISTNGTANFLTSNNSDTRAKFNGSDKTLPSAQWELLTKQDLIDELSAASMDKPMNATFLISGFDFNMYDSRNTKWGGDPSMNGYFNVSANGYKRYAEKKGGTNGSSFNVTQTLTGLPKGYYILTAQAFYRNGTDTENTNVNAYIYAGEQSVKVPAINDGGTIPVDTDEKGVADAFYNDRGRYKTTPLLAYVNSDNGSLTIGIKSDVAVANDWTAFDNFQLLYCGDLSGLYTGGGSYYLQNVATGEYLQGGMSYGTKAVLGNGIEFSLERQSNNGTYRIGSGIASRTDYKYLCDEASIDHIATDFFITETSSGSGIYTISTTIDGCTGEGQANDGVSGRLLTAKDATFSIDLKYVHFNIWDSPLPGASCTTVNGPCTIYNLNNGDPLFYGDGNVGYLHYADISEYQSLTIKGTGGGKLRVLLNRTKDGGTVEEGALTEVWLDMSSGSATLDLTKYPYAHLHAIKVGERTVTVTEATLQKKQQAVTFESGKKSTDAYSQWRFVTEQDRLTDLATATPSRPKDATFLIKGASFTVGDERRSRWTGNGFDVARGWERPDDGAAGVKSEGRIDVSQQLYNLPNGTYIITMQGGHKNGTNAQFYANDESVALAAVATDVTNVASASLSTYYTTNYQQTLKVKVTNGSLKLGVSGDTPSNTEDNLLFFDNFRLTYLGNVEENTYYMRNVATRDFIRAGGHYEAQAIRDDWGLAMNFIIKSGGTICSIDSRISNGGDNQYLGTNGFLDSPETEFTLENLGNNKYAIRTTDSKYLATADGDNYVNFDRGVQSGDTHAQWELLTREQLIEELKTSGASDSNPKDATFLIEGSNLGRHDLRNNSTNWTGIDFSSNEYGGVESVDWNSQDNYANSVIEKFNKNFDTYQTISGLPAGVYELTVQGYYRSGNTATAAGKTNDGTDILRPILYVKQEGKLIGQAPLHSIFDGGVSNQTDGFSTSVNGEWLPNSLSDAAKTFRDDHYMPSGECNK